jgi:glycyl-tRNA synthetase beta chain
MDYLIEIGTEELPAGTTGEIAQSLQNIFQKKLFENGLVDLNHELFSTPRRIAIFVSGLPQKTPEKQELIKGPGLTAPENAIDGFARKNETTVGELEQIDGRYCHRKTVNPVPIGEVLKSSLEAAFASLTGDRWMTWAKGEQSFARPVRWLVSLLDREVFPLSLFDLTANRKSRVNRLLEAPSNGFKYIDLPSAKDYARTLRQFNVEPSRESRRASILQQIEVLKTKYHFKAEVSDELLEEVVDLLEWPVALVGSFEESFLELPDFLVKTVLMHHQRYFPCYDSQGKLLNKFVFISNSLTEAQKTVILGNERVLRARLKDAEFFVQEDLKVPLANRKAKLVQMTFQKELGEGATTKDKADRIQRIAEEIATKLNLPKTEFEILSKGAALAKCDLASSMVFEFPELQGLAGGFIAKKQMQSERLGQIIAEQYLPVALGKALPASKMGAILSLADKIDNLVALFSIGKVPTGSADPFALRRQTQGIIEILISRFKEDFQELTLKELLQIGYLVLNKNMSEDPSEKTNPALFVLQRLIYVLSQHFEQKSVEALVCISNPKGQSHNLMQILNTNPYKIQKSLLALGRVVDNDHQSFLASLTSIRRVSRILNGFVPTGEPDKELFKKAVEEELRLSITNFEKALKSLGEEQKWSYLENLQKPIDAFFDDVMVEDPDPAIAQNRKNLLAKLRNLLDETLGSPDWEALLACYEKAC